MSRKGQIGSKSHVVSMATSRQKPDGDLSAGDAPKMRAHAWATYTLCTAYGLTGDRKIGAAAQKAITLIERSQDAKTGGWIDLRQLADALVLRLADHGVEGGVGTDLTVSPAALQAAERFVVRQAASDGVRFGEIGPSEPGDQATAMGLVCHWGTFRIGSRNMPLLREGAAEPEPGRKRGTEFPGQEGTIVQGRSLQPLRNDVSCSRTQAGSGKHGLRPWAHKRSSSRSRKATRREVGSPPTTLKPPKVAVYSKRRSTR